MWNDMLLLLPGPIRNALRGYRDSLCEIRIRRKAPLCVTLLLPSSGRAVFENRALGLVVSDALMDQTVRELTENSLYSHEDTLKDGYITVHGSYRIGVAGDLIAESGKTPFLKRIDMLAIRLWREIPDSSKELYHLLSESQFEASVLLYAPPAMAKTTLLRDLACQLTQQTPAVKVALIDSRREVATPSLQGLAHLDILSGYSKVRGLEIASRLFSPEYILCDEIGQGEDARSLLSLQALGLPTVMTAHGRYLHELLSRGAFRELHEKRYFDYYVRVVAIVPMRPPILEVTPYGRVSF